MAEEGRQPTKSGRTTTALMRKPQNHFLPLYDPFSLHRGKGPVESCMQVLVMSSISSKLKQVCTRGKLG
jgi:hypothetical protein